MLIKVTQSNSSGMQLGHSQVTNHSWYLILGKSILFLFYGAITSLG